uniref:Uncharacterized protein n=1 Tax=Heliothis virescens TaxID=7102 RepID=A0A2A4K9Z2_HELVI
MELVSLAKEVFQSVAEHAASYRLGQSALRHVDRTLWVVEKCARWAVPPPCHPFNSKRRYLRTLKYAGNRMMRARSSTAPRDSWADALHQLFQFTMCFRRQDHYGNNNTTRISNNDEVLVVKRSKRGREHTSPAASTSETTMERLIEKMMVDLDADSDEDSSFTLTNVTSPKSDRSDFTTESDQDTVYHNNVPTKQTTQNCQVDSPFSPNMSEVPCSTPERNETWSKGVTTPPEDERENLNETTLIGEKLNETGNKLAATLPLQESIKEENQKSPEISPSKIPRTPNNEQKIANGRTVKSVPSKKKGSIAEKDRRNSDLHAGKNIPGNNTL